MPELALLIMIGVITIILGFLLVAFGMTRSVKEQEQTEEEYDSHETREKSVKGGGVILIGPVPVIFGSDKKSVLILMVLAIVLMILAIVFLNFANTMKK